MKKLYRNLDRKVIAGICAGLSDRFQVDVAVIRIAFIITALFEGFGVLVYLILWLALPEGNPDPSETINYKQLFLDPNNAKIAGVCAGIAEFLNTDVSLVRIIFLISILFGGIGILAYLICWIAFPKKV